MPYYQQQRNDQKGFNAGGWLKAQTCKEEPRSLWRENGFLFITIAIHFIFLFLSLQKRKIKVSWGMIKYWQNTLGELKWKNAASVSIVEISAPGPLLLSCHIYFPQQQLGNSGTSYSMNSSNEPSHITVTKRSVFAMGLVYRDAW